MKTDIKSFWTYEKGRWSEEHNDYIDRNTSEPQEKILTMEIVDHGTGPILQFNGGPTGYESYYVADLVARQPKGAYMAICAGTINSWAQCRVRSQDVVAFLSAAGFISETNEEVKA